VKDWSRAKSLLVWISRELTGILGFLAVATGILKAFELLGHKLCSPYNWISFWAVFGALEIRYLIERGHTPLWRALWRAITFIPWNLLLLLFGHDYQRRRLMDLQLVTNAVQQSALFARVVGLKTGVTSKYYILFSHKDKEGGGNHHSIGKGERYRIPGFPVDEAECIIRLWYLAASTLNLRWADIQTLCSCTWNNEPTRDRVLDSSLAIVGSPKHNEYAAQLVERLKQFESKGQIKRETVYYMVVENGLCFLQPYQPALEALKPDLTEGSPTGILKDYAVLMRLPNLLAKDHATNNILLVAGCKVAGQVALTDWFSEAGNLGGLASDFGPDPFQVIFRVRYEYVEGGVPKIRSTEELYREKINVRFEKARSTAGAKR
jgi:hypothetical protein